MRHPRAPWQVHGYANVGYSQSPIFGPRRIRTFGKITSRDAQPRVQPDPPVRVFYLAGAVRSPPVSLVR